MQIIYVEYDGGLNPEMDEKLRQAAGGKPPSDSGCMFLPPHTRDMRWRFGSKTVAEEVAAKMRAIKGVTVTVEEE